MNGKHILKHYIGDAVVCAALAIILTVVCFAFSRSDDTNKQVRVLKGGEVIAVYDLSEDNALNVDGVIIKVHNGRAFIEDSDCADKICMSMHGVDNNGGGSVCIPNKVVLEPVKNVGNTDAVAG